MLSSRNFTLLLFLAWLGVVVAVGAAPACIPDLPADLADGAAGEAPSSAPSGSTSASGGPVCGNGIIELDAGEQCDPTVPLDPDASFLGCRGDCTMVCDGLRWARNNHCYQLIPQSANALDNGTSGAEGLCELLGGHAVTFASEEEFQAVADYYLEAGADAGPFWLGLQEANSHWSAIFVNEPGWASNCHGCYAHVAPDASAIPLADSRDNMSFCAQAVAADGGSPWTAIRCMGISPKIRVVCEREPRGNLARDCDDGICIDLVWTYGQKRYVYRPNAPDEHAAVQACQGMGGRLVVLQSRDEREQLWRELLKLVSSPQYIWIGLSLLPGGDAGPASWVWDDGANADAYPPPWGGSEPHTSGTGITTRAYLAHVSANFDDTLAHNGPPLASPSFVCELAVDAGADSGSASTSDSGDDSGDGSGDDSANDSE
jgi:hypothetical protein